MSNIELIFTFVVDEETIRHHLGAAVPDAIESFNRYYERFPSEAVQFIQQRKKTQSVVARLHNE